MITIEEFRKLDLRIGKIKHVEDIPESDKLYRLEVDFGNEKRQLVAGIRGSYSKEQLIGKEIVVVANLQPAKIRGVESQGMLLAAEDEKPIILIPEREVKLGSKVR